MCKEVIDPYGFIYITTNMINGKRYIGQKKFDGGSRWKSYLGSGHYLMKAIKKYGKNNFIRNIVDIAYSFDELNEKEKAWIDNYNAVDSEDFYNRIEGGDVSGQLKKRNSVPIICLNNKMKFDSIADAIIWSGHNLKTIKNTYNLSFKIYKYKKLIFRPLNKMCCDCNELFYSTNKREKKCEKCGNYFQCVDCGLDFEKVNQRQIRCDECQEIRKKELARLRKIKHRKKSKLSEKELNALIEKERNIEKGLNSRIWLQPAKKRSRVKVIKGYE